MLENLDMATGILDNGSQRVKNSLKISDATNEDIFQLNLTRIGGKIGK